MVDQSRYHSIVSLVQNNRFSDAISPIKSLVQDFPQQPHYWHLYSVIMLKIGQSDRAVECAQKAVLLVDNSPEFSVQLAITLQKALRFGEAKSTADKVSLMQGQSAYHWDSLGTVYSGIGEHDKAQKMYQKAVALVPTRSDFKFNLATALRSNGELAQAELVYDDVINANPHDYEAYNNRSHLRKQTVANNHIDSLKNVLLKGFSDWRDEVKICFALAKECEDVEQYSDAFSYLQRGCSLRRQQSNYSVDGELKAIDQIIATFSQQVIESTHSLSESAEPIFILGLPRTGTTLVERIVGSHSKVISAGELKNFSAKMVNLVVDYAGKQQPIINLDKSNLISNSINIDFTKLAQDYIDSTRPLTGKTAHFIDKLPLNYLYIGLIAMALPKVKIIHLTRHPMDTCYAIYKTLFKDAYPFSYDLEDLGRYYLGYHKLMKHWHKVMPEKILNVSYESLVANQEAQSRRLIEYCGLEWEEQCLSFHKNAQSSTTASAAQIRQPIYNSSVQKWRHYEAQLQPLANFLRKNGIEL